MSKCSTPFGIKDHFTPAFLTPTSRAFMAGISRTSVNNTNFSLMFIKKALASRNRLTSQQKTVSSTSWYKNSPKTADYLKLTVHYQQPTRLISQILDSEHFKFWRGFRPVDIWSAVTDPGGATLAQTDNNNIVFIGQ
jgi:hypothetical protein